MEILEKNVGWDKNHYLVRKNGRNILTPKYLIDYEAAISTLLNKCKNIQRNGGNTVFIGKESPLSEFEGFNGEFRFEIIENDRVRVQVHEKHSFN